MRKLCGILIISGLLILISAGYAHAQEGKKAPALAAQDWINADKDTTLKTFEGKIIFVEFTATW